MLRVFVIFLTLAFNISNKIKVSRVISFALITLGGRVFIMRIADHAN